MNVRTCTFALAAAVVAAASFSRPARAQRECAAPEGSALVISTEPVQVAPGERVDVNVVWFAGEYRPPDAVPARCAVR